MSKIVNLPPCRQAHNQKQRKKEYRLCKFLKRKMTNHKLKCNTIIERDKLSKN